MKKQPKKNIIESLRVMIDQLPISQKAKSEHAELNFDIDWGYDICCQYSIDQGGYLCQEKWAYDPISKTYIVTSVKRLKITQDIFVETEIIGKPARFEVSIVDGKVKNITKVRI